MAVTSETLGLDQFFAAYQQGQTPASNSVASLIPLPNQDLDETSSLFDWDSKNNILSRRSDISNVYDHHSTSDWWGWTTLILLASLKATTAARCANS